MIPITKTADRLADLNSMLFSLVLHFAALIGMGLLAAASPQDWGGVKLLVNVDQGETPLIDDVPLEELVELEVAAEPAAAMSALHGNDDLVVPTTDFASVDALSRSSANAFALEGIDLSGNGVLSQTGGAAATEFFGIGGYGQSFVYVVDCSDSMNERGKFNRARYELLQSIERLASDQRYFVIFFNDEAHPMDAGELVPATEDQFARAAEWVAYVEAHGGTNPLPALLLALSLRPDAIYFLSDGQFDPLTIAQLKVSNRPRHRIGQRVPIHSVAFVDRGTIRLMKTIARNSGGEFRFVN
jgi:von Willebrand factor type A domain